MSSCQESQIASFDFKLEKSQQIKLETFHPQTIHY
jgi:hypothetical protein